MKKDRKDSGYT